MAHFAVQCQPYCTLTAAILPRNIADIANRNWRTFISPLPREESGMGFIANRNGPACVSPLPREGPGVGFYISKGDVGTKAFEGFRGKRLEEPKVVKPLQRTAKSAIIHDIAGHIEVDIRVMSQLRKRELIDIQP